MTLDQIKEELSRLHDRELAGTKFMEHYRSAQLWACGKAQGYLEAITLLEKCEVETQKIL